VHCTQYERHSGQCETLLFWMAHISIRYQLVREAVSYRGLFTAGWFGVREKHCFWLEIYDRLRASEQSKISIDRLINSVRTMITNHNMICRGQGGRAKATSHRSPSPSFFPPHQSCTPAARDDVATVGLTQMHLDRLQSPSRLSALLV